MYQLYMGWTHGSFTNFESSARNHIATRGLDKQRYLLDFNIYPGWGDYYITHLQALFSPDETGEYSFYLQVDDFAMLFIGYNDQAASRKLVVTTNSGYLFLIIKLDFFRKQESHNVQLNISLYHPYIFSQSWKEYKFTLAYKYLY